MTKEEIESNYEFKLTKKTLLRQFPWIKDMVPCEDEEEYKSLCFVELIIDPFELAEERGWEVASYVSPVGSFMQHRGFTSPYLSTYYKERESPGEVEKQIENEMKMIHDTPAIPTDLKLKKRIYPSTWRYISTPTQSS